MTLSIEIKPCEFIPEARIVSLSNLSEEFVAKTNQWVMDWLRETWNQLTEGGTRKFSCPSLGSWDEDETGIHSWAIMDDLSIEVHMERREICLILYCQPDADDALDPAHEHWTEPKESWWLDALCVIRKLEKSVGASLRD